MIRKLLIGPALAAGIALTGCSTTGGLPSITPDQIAQVQSTASAICSFVPTASTVAKIIASFAGASGVVDVVSQAATGICNAVTTSAKSVRLRGGKRGVAAPVYRGVRIRGSFAR